jgi:hypothetical protein
LKGAASCATAAKLEFGAHVPSKHTGTRHGSARRTTIIDCAI